MNPFYDEHGQMSVMIMSCSAGIMEGDCQEIALEVGENAKAKIFSQSFEKIHKMDSGFATRDTTIHIKRNGFLEYSPLPTIPFAGSSFIANTKIELESKSSKLIFSDILSAGRIAQGEMFKYKEYRSKLTVYSANELVYFDNANYKPNILDMNDFCLQEGYSHQASLLLFNFNISNDHLKKLQEYIETICQEQDIACGYSQTAFGDTIIRSLGRSAEILQNIQSSIIKIII